MAVNAGSALELGAALKKLRNDRGVSTEALGKRIGVSSANFTFWERGERVPREEHLLNILDELGVDDAERKRLIGLRWRASGPPDQLVTGAPSIGPPLAELIEFEQTANELIDIAPLMVPGLLQTEDYAAATFVDMSEVATRVALRVGRQKKITRARQPVRYTAFIDSEALIRPVVGADAMVEQLRHLLEMQQRENVTVRLVSSTHPGYNPMLAGPCMVLKFPTADPVIHLEHESTAGFVRKEEDVRRYLAAVEKVARIAMTPARTAEVIAEIVNGMETT